MSEEPEKVPSCYADLGTVFPLGADGLRHTPLDCLLCPHKTPCLRSAMDRADGLKAREEYVDRAWTSGMMGFFERWSRKKDLQRRIKEKARQKKDRRPGSAPRPGENGESGRTEEK